MSFIGPSETEDAPGALPFGSTIYQRVHERLRAEILDGRLAPGGRLKIQELASRFGLSHMPVREALQKLEGEGLVVVQPNRGTSVRHIDAKLLEHAYDVIEALDSLLTAKAAEAVSKAGMLRIRAAQQAFEAAACRRDLQACLAANEAFHKAIHAASGNEEGARLVTTPDGLIRALRSRLGYSGDRLQDVAHDHAAMVAAIAERDTEGARKLAIAHIRTARIDLIERFAMHEKAMGESVRSPAQL
ncbi:MAG: GntR family transcriptional regulator [Rhodospirillales bacterium]|nr:GntR family transcriptional regulator [Rhodospirillales bacterium]